MKLNKTLSISILSGKGGVGKTNIALNLGFSLYKGNHSVMLMDCDMGLANLDVLLGLAPEKNLQDILDTDIDPKEVAVSIEPNGFDFLPAASGVPELIEMEEELRAALFDRLINTFERYDYLFLDLGAGITPTVLSFAAISKVRLVVVTPEPTSLTDCYALIKVLNSQYNVSDFQVLVNMAEDAKEAKETFYRLSAACQKFLGIDLNYTGYIRSDKTLIEAVRRQTPLMKLKPKSIAGQDIFNVALKLRRLRDEMLPEIADEPVLNMRPLQNFEKDLD